MQADWVESVYTIAYSKPWVEPISYWDFNGKGHDGFVTTEGKTRESYHRLRSLLAKWRDEAERRWSTSAVSLRISRGLAAVA